MNLKKIFALSLVVAVCTSPLHSMAAQPRTPLTPQMQQEDEALKACYLECKKLKEKDKLGYEECMLTCNNNNKAAAKRSSRK